MHEEAYFIYQVDFHKILNILLDYISLCSVGCLPDAPGGRIFYYQPRSFDSVILVNVKKTHPAAAITAAKYQTMNTLCSIHSTLVGAWKSWSIKFI